MTNLKVRLLVLLILTWLSTWYVTDKLIIPYAEERIAFAQLTMDGENVPPYRYRLFEPTVDHIFQTVLIVGISDPILRHVGSYFLFTLIVFAVLYQLLYRYLSQLFTPKIALVGLLLFQVVVPLAVTGYYMEGDFVTVVVYLAALNLMLTKHDRWLILVIAIGAFVREQTIFIVFIYFIYHFANRTLTREVFGIAALSILVFGVIFIGLRAALGVVPTPYTVTFHITENLSASRLFLETIPLWLGEILGFFALSIMAYKKSPRFFRFALLGLIVYIVLFFFNGLFNELGKFLPAHLILIPMSLQVLMGEYMNENKKT